MSDRVASPSHVLSAPTPGSTEPLTLAGTQYSRPVVCGAGAAASFHLKFAGTPTTAITVWTTNIPKRHRLAEGTDADWVQETAIVVTGPAGAALNVMIHVVDLACEEIRVKLVTSAGTGTVDGWGKASA